MTQMREGGGGWGAGEATLEKKRKTPRDQVILMRFVSVTSLVHFMFELAGCIYCIPVHIQVHVPCVNTMYSSF